MNDHSEVRNQLAAEEVKVNESMSNLGNDRMNIHMTARMHSESTLNQLVTSNSFHPSLVQSMNQLLPPNAFQMNTSNHINTLTNTNNESLQQSRRIHNSPRNQHGNLFTALQQRSLCRTIERTNTDLTRIITTLFVHSMSTHTQIEAQLNDGHERLSTISMDSNCNGSELATGHGDHTCRIWNVFNDAVKLRHIFRGHPRTVCTIKYHPYLEHIVATGCLGGHLKIWNTLSGELLVCHDFRSSSSHRIASISFSPLSEHLLISFVHRNYVWLWFCCDHLTIQCTNCMRTSIPQVTNQWYCTCGNLLIRPDEPPTPTKLIAFLKSHGKENLYRYLSFHPSGEYLLTGERTVLPDGLASLFQSFPPTVSINVWSLDYKRMKANPPRGLVPALLCTIPHTLFYNDCGIALTTDRLATIQLHPTPNSIIPTPALTVLSLSPSTMGTVLSATPVIDCTEITCVRFTQDLQYMMLGYQVGEKRQQRQALNQLSARQILGHAHHLLQQVVYRVADWQVMRTWYSDSRSDCLNTACFHVSPGIGLFQGTNVGDIRLLTMKRVTEQTIEHETVDTPYATIGCIRTRTLLNMKQQIKPNANTSTELSPELRQSDTSTSTDTTSSNQMERILMTD